MAIASSRFLCYNGREVSVMEYSFAPLYVRVITFLLLGLVLSVILFLWTKKHKITLRIILQIVTASLFLACSCSTIFSLVYPQVKTVTCTFVKTERSADQINLFSQDSEWLCEGESLWIELDTLTKDRVFQGFQEMESGKIYVVTYEERENLILGIREN